MADVITRLKLESGEFDSKIKRATQGLLQMEQDCRKVGGTLGILEQDQKKFVQSLGQMQTVSTTVRGKIGELTSAYTELSVQYKRLTDEEKQGDYGRALTASLEQLKTRIAESKAQLAEVNSELGNTSRTGGETGGVLDQLAGKFGLNVGQLAKFGGALGVATAAAKVAKDAFFANEEQLDEWGRIVESSESLYRGFLNALNNGNISGFLSSINTITQAAREAYDALDALNTFNAFNQVNVEKTRTGMTESISDYREGNATKETVKAAGEAYQKELRQRQKMEREAYLAAIKKTAAERGISAADLQKALGGSYGNYQELKNIPLTGKRTGFTGGGVAGVGTTYTVAVAANERERLGESLRKLNDTELQSLQALGAQAERTGNEIASVDKQLSRILRGNGGGGGGATTTKVPRGGGGSSVVKSEEQLNSEKINALTQEYVNATKERQTAIQSEIKGLQERNAEIQRLKDEAQGKIKVFEPGTMEFYQDSLKTLQKELLTLREKGADPIEIDFKTDEIKDVQREIDRLNGKVTVEVELKRPPSIEEQLRTEISDQNVAADEASLRGLMKTTIANNIEGIDFTAVREKMVEGLNIPDEEWQTIVDAINEKLVAMDLEPIKLNFETGSVSKEGKAVTDSWKSAAQAVQSVGQAMQQIEDPVAKVAGIVGQAIATIALTFAQSLKGTVTPWDWIAAAAAGTATMVSTIAAIKSATSTQKFANGGIVQGNTYSGDQIDIKANAGEVVLSRAQQGNLAEQLSGGGIGNMQLEARVSAEDLIFVLNNNGLRRGYGKYIKD